MSSWLKDGEVLEGTGSGQMSPSARLPGRTARFPSSSDAPPPASDRQDRMSKAKELFELCDKEGKGFITKRDMQRLQQELPLSPEQLESVFESLDRDKNGYLTPLEFHTGLGELVGCGPEEERARSEERQKVEPAEIRFTNILMELGADKLFKDQWELCTLWAELQRDKPELLGVLEEVLSYTVSHLQDALKERDNLEQALRRREEDHDRVVRSMYEDMESQLKEEREKRHALDSVRQGDKKEQLLQELRAQEQELEFTLTKQRELESRISTLNSDQANTRGENRRLHNLNQQLQDELEQSREKLQQTLSQLQQLPVKAFFFLILLLLQRASGDTQRVFKVVFLGNSSVGKSSFIHQYCSGHFPNNMASTPCHPRFIQRRHVAFYMLSRLLSLSIFA